MTKQNSLTVLTDNWLLTEVAQLLARRWATADIVSSITVCSDGGIAEEKLPEGVFQLASLLSFLELLVLCDSISVLGSRWVNRWQGKHKGLDSLLRVGVISTVGFPKRSYDNERQAYRKYMTDHPPLDGGSPEKADLYGYGFSGPDLFGQIVDGASTYLALSDARDTVYCPHPARARVMDDTICHLRWPSDAVGKITEMVSGVRTKLAKAIRGTAQITRLSYRVSPFSALVLKESRDQDSILSTAAELRSDKSIVELRAALADMSAALKNDDVDQYIGMCRKIDAAVLEVERRLHLRALTSTDGPSNMSVFSLPIRVPDGLRRPVPAPRYTRVITRLVKSGSIDVGKQLTRLLGPESAAAIRALSRWVPPYTDDPRKDFLQGPAKTGPAADGSA